MRIGDKLKELRLERELTQYKAANAVDISRSVLSQYENNLVDPTSNVIIKFAKFYNVSTDYLLGLDEQSDFKFPATPTVSSSESYSQEERQLIEKYRELNAPGKKLIDTTINTLLGSTPKSEQHSQQKKNKIS